MNTSATQEEATDVPEPEYQDLLDRLLPHWRAIAGVCLLVITGMLAMTFMSSSRQRAKELAAAEMLAAGASQDAVSLQRVADARQGQPIGVWAQQAAAQARLIEGSAALSSDREEAKKAIADAVAGFEKALAQSANVPLIQQRAMWGLGQAFECQNELDKAVAQYTKLAQTWPEIALAKQAQARIDSLSTADTKAFYDWYFAQNPADLLPPEGETPSVPFTAPSEPDVNVPDPADAAVDATSTGEAVTTDAAETEEAAETDGETADAGEATEADGDESGN